MDKAKEILENVINTYSDGVYKYSRMSAVSYNMALEAVREALKTSSNPLIKSGCVCGWTGRDRAHYKGQQCSVCGEII